MHHASITTVSPHLVHTGSQSKQCPNTLYTSCLKHHTNRTLYTSCLNHQCPHTMYTSCLNLHSVPTLSKHHVSIITVSLHSVDTMPQSPQCPHTMFTSCLIHHTIPTPTTHHAAIMTVHHASRMSNVSSFLLVTTICRLTVLQGAAFSQTWNLPTSIHDMKRTLSLHHVSGVS